MWSSQTHTHTSSTPSARFFFILTLSHASVIIITTTHICMHMRAFSRTRIECVCVVYFIMCTHRLTFVYIHLWLDCGPFWNSSMDFFSRLCVSLSVFCFVSRFGRWRICCRFFCGLFWIVFLCLEMLMSFFSHDISLYCFFKCGDGGNDSSFLHKIDNLNGIF